MEKNRRETASRERKLAHLARAGQGRQRAEPGIDCQREASKPRLYHPKRRCARGDQCDPVPQPKTSAKALATPGVASGPKVAGAVAVMATLKRSLTLVPVSV